MQPIRIQPTEEEKKINELENEAIKIYNEKGIIELKLFLHKVKTNSSLGTIIIKNESLEILEVHCPKCGSKVKLKASNTGKLTGRVGGAIAGTIPGAILGAVFGGNFGKTYDNQTCQKCSIDFAIPNSLRNSADSYVRKKLTIKDTEGIIAESQKRDTLKNKFLAKIESLNLKPAK